jgi:hypothetical protein
VNHKHAEFVCGSLACDRRSGGVVAALAPAYLPRRPTETALYALVRDHLETFLASV